MIFEVAIYLAHSYICSYADIIDIFSICNSVNALNKNVAKFSSSTATTRNKIDILSNIEQPITIVAVMHASRL